MRLANRSATITGAASGIGKGHCHACPCLPGPIKTRATGGLKDCDLLLSEAAKRTPIGDLVDIDDVGMGTAYVTTPYARRITGSTVYVDAGLTSWHEKAVGCDCELWAKGPAEPVCGANNASCPAQSS